MELIICVPSDCIGPIHLWMHLFKDFQQPQDLRLMVILDGISEIQFTLTSMQTTAYYIPEEEIRLFSPQMYFCKNISG